MKQKILVASGALVVLLAVLAGWRWQSPTRAQGALPHEAYVWQRAWTEPVQEAVAQHATNFTQIVVLGAEVSWKEGRTQVVRVVVDHPSLRQAGVPVGIALRIGGARPRPRNWSAMAEIVR